MLIFQKNIVKNNILIIFNIINKLINFKKID
jgi:hypothetical protein